MSLSDGGNGNGAAGDVKLDTLVLTYDVATDHLEIGGKFSSLDKGLDMLARATRTLESRWRLQSLQQLQQAAADAALQQRIMQGQRR